MALCETLLCWTCQTPLPAVNYHLSILPCRGINSITAKCCVFQALKENLFWHRQWKKKNPLPVLLIHKTHVGRSDIDSAGNHRQLSHSLHVIPVFQGNSLCGNSLCLTSPGDRMRLIQGTWSILLLLREINTRSHTSNQALITFSLLIALGRDVI